MSSVPPFNSEAFAKPSVWPIATDHTPRELHSAASAVSWGAIFAGATAAAALSLVLLILGTGLGLSSVSPWARSGMNAGTLGWAAIAWITLTQIAAAGLGGYLAGRLRSRWLVAHRDEVYFRDTAHGFLAWAIATLGTAALLTSTISTIVGSGVSLAGGAVTAGMALSKQDDANPTLSYYVDRVLRRDTSLSANPANSADSAPTSADPRMPEMLRLLAKNIKAGKFSEGDLRYAGQWVAQRTGLPQDQAQARVASIYAEAQTALRNAEITAKEGTNAARKASAYTALWLVIALMLGAFSASLAATLLVSSIVFTTPSYV